MLEAAAKAPNPAADCAALADAPKVVSTPEVINGLLEIAADAGSVKPEEGVVDGPAKFEPSVAAGAPARMYIKWWCLLAIHHTEKGNLTPILKKRKERLRLLALMSFPVAYYLMGNEDTTLISSLASNPKRTVIRGHVTGCQTSLRLHCSSSWYSFCTAQCWCKAQRQSQHMHFELKPIASSTLELLKANKQILGEFIDHVSTWESGSRTN